MNQQRPNTSEDLYDRRRRVMFASTAAAELLRASGLDQIDAVFAAGDADALRHRGRRVYARKIALPDGTVRKVFVKLNWGRKRLWPRMTDLKTGQMYQSLPVREWRGIDRFAAIGLHVPERLGLFREGFFSFRDAVIVGEVPPEFSVDEMLQNGRWWDLSREQQSRLLRAMLDTLRTIHSAGLGWRGSSSRHFYPLLQADGTWKLWLIDCEGVHRAWSRRVEQRDCSKLWRAMRESGADAHTLAELKSLIEGNDVAFAGDMRSNRAA